MTDEEMALSVLDGLSGIRDTLMRCSSGEGCASPLRGAVGQPIFCPDCGRVYQTRLQEDSSLWALPNDRRPLWETGYKLRKP